MWPIIFRILFPGVTLVIVSGGLAFYEYCSYKKKKKRQTRIKKTKKIRAFVFSMIALLGAWYSVLGSMDLILKDFITYQGEYIYYQRGKGLYVQNLFFLVDNKQKTCETFSNIGKNLEEGKCYEFTYAKRTLMLISIEEIYP